MTVLAIQRALLGLGYDPGPLDNIMGPLTQKAIKAFQSDKGLQVDGIVGPITTAALNFAIATTTTTSTTSGDDDDGTETATITATDDDGIEGVPPTTVTIEEPLPPPATSAGLSFLEQTNALLPWLPNSLATIYANVWAENADTDLALAAVRADTGYDDLLPGNRRPDGTFRMTEAEYFSTVDSFNRTLAQINLNPEVFRSMFVRAIEGEVSAREFQDRVTNAYTNILVNLPQVRSFYANEYNTDLTDESIIASVLSPEIGEQVLNRRILSSQIGGSAALRGFDLGLNEAGRLAAAGLNQGTSAQFFATAARALPALRGFAQRFNEGTFDLAEFTEGNVFGDPKVNAKIERLFALEAGSFNSQRGVTTGQRVGQRRGVAVR